MQQPKAKRTVSEDLIRFNDQFYILASSPLIDVKTRVLKHGETFGVFDRYGDIQPVGLGEQGLYHDGTRFLSYFLLSIDEQRPLLLSSTVKNDNALLTVDLTNPDIEEDNRIILPRGLLHIFRAKFLWEGVCYERLRITNYGQAPANVRFKVHYEADYADIFEVRGMTREQRGEFLDEIVEDAAVVLRYKGLDEKIRTTRIECSGVPRSINRSEMDFAMTVDPHTEQLFVITVSCQTEREVVDRLPYDDAFLVASEALNTEKIESAQIYTSNDQLNVLINRSLVDLHMMTSRTPYGSYPYAGVPWFCAPFGRDGIITALECLAFNPAVARGVLSFLAGTQADRENPEQDAQPGKIVHEMRKGEMAALHEVPFGTYYGSVDATPLFVLLAGAYYERTADLSFVTQIWPNIERALKWIDTYGDMDHDGFVEYYRHSQKGLIQQGWKDSHDSVFHSDGALAEGPIALCEVQAYVYAAKKKASLLASALGNLPLATRLEAQAEDLRAHFRSAFWSEELSLFALALDGEKRQCKVRSSNAGHCLFTGITTVEEARNIAETLFSNELYSGWGIRTLATNEVRYNPMSYHNGSVWPHDNALIAAGLAAYRMKDLAAKIWEDLFEASHFMDLHRLPELFCGFIRRPSEGPTLYPVACAPQAWAAGSVFLLIQSALGLTINARTSAITFERPLLPDFIDKMWIRNLHVGEASVDLELERYEKNIGIKVLRREGDVQIIAIK